MSKRYSPWKNSLAGISKRAASVSAPLLVLICLCGCAATQKPFTAPPGSEAARILNSLKDSENKRSTFRGVGRFKIHRGSKAKTFRIAWMGSKPHSVRVETLGPWGQPILTLIVHGSTYHAYSRQDNRYFTGEATPRNLSRFISMPLSAEDLFQLLSGNPRSSRLTTQRSGLQRKAPDGY